MRSELNKKIATIAILAALAMILSYVESLIPSFGIPGVKLGLANISIILILYCFNFWYALAISLVRVLVTSLLIGNFFQMGFFMSVLGSILSLLIMFLIKTIFKKFTVIGVSVFGSVAHVTGQIIIASFYLGSTTALYYYPIILISSIITGVLVGIVSLKVMKTKVFINLKETKNPTA